MTKDDPTTLTIQSYDSTVQEYIKKTTSLDILGTFEKYFIFPKGAKILDAGCAYGRDVEILKKRGFDVVGVDLSRNMIAEAKKRVPTAAFYISDVRGLPFQDSVFDVVLCNAVLMHLEKKEMGKALKELHRVLKKGGKLLLCDKEGTGEGIKIDEPGIQRYCAYFTLPEMSEYLEQSGFTILHAWIGRDLRGRDINWVHTIAEK